MSKATHSYKGQNIVLVGKSSAWTTYRLPGSTTNLKARIKSEELKNPIKGKIHSVTPSAGQKALMDDIKRVISNKKPVKEVATKTKSKVDPDYKRGLHVGKIDGKRTQDCDDEVAHKFRGKTLDELYAFIAKDMTHWKHPKVAHSGTGGGAEIIEKDLHNMYKHCNSGMQRMNLGNIYRAHCRQTHKQ